MSETNIVREILLRASNIGQRLWRQQTGVGWIGKAYKITRRETVTLEPGDVVIRQARPFHAGFEGQPDTGGYASEIITPDMVGTRAAFATEIEVKTATGRAREKQIAYLNMASAMGVRCGIARDPDTAEKILRGELRWKNGDHG